MLVLVVLSRSAKEGIVDSEQLKNLKMMMTRDSFYLLHMRSSKHTHARAHDRMSPTLY
jgi:hypothetical protein